MSPSDTPVFYRIVPSRPEAHYFTVCLYLPNSDTVERLCLPAWIPGSYMIRDFARNIVAIRAWRRRIKRQEGGDAGETSEAGMPTRSRQSTGMYECRVKQDVESGQGWIHGVFPSSAPAPPIKQVGWEEVAPKALDKQCWEVPGSGELLVEYQVYAWDASVRAAHLDQGHAFFNGTSLFLRVAGRESAPCELEIRPPAGPVWGHWQVATTLPRREIDEAGFGRYRADDYWHLIDCPVEMGEFRTLEFQVAGVPHKLVVRGRAEFDGERLVEDLARICGEQVELFGELPLSQYLFLVNATADGYGGLEHRDSCALLCSRKELPPYGLQGTTADYRRFLGLCSHEYFHLWNVKRIRPQRLAASDLEAEAYTRLLWAFEGITSYYDELMLARSGVVTPEEYLEMLAHAITRVMRTPGRRLQSLAESSFYAWTKFYKQDENAPNVIVSYYAKGALAALGLDVELRLRSGERLCLDDLMRHFWQEYGRRGNPLPEEGIRQAAESLLGAELGDFFDQVVEGTEELPLARWLNELGVGFRLRPARNEEDLGGVAGSDDEEAPSPRPMLGARWRQQGDFLELLQVFEGQAAQRAGLSAGDRIVAVDGLQVTADNLERLLTLPPGRDSVEVAAFRGDELRRFVLHPAPAPADTCELWLLEEHETGAEVLDRRRRWLGR